jgi:hypothetical protein
MSWETDGVMAIATYHSINVHPTTFELMGAVNPEAPVNDRVSVVFPKALGTYQFAANSSALGELLITRPYNPSLYLAGINSSTGAFIGAGTVVVTQLSGKSVAGTFTFRGVDPEDPSGVSKQISNGKFFVRL